jgi:group I intron endonuclease
MFVYLITNKVNGKKYVGQHSGEELSTYWRHCVCAALRGSTDKPFLYNAVRKYGQENFEVQPLVQVSSKWEMDLYERGLVKALQTRKPDGYNLTDGGDGQLGRSPTEETREKISKTKKAQNRHWSEEDKQWRREMSTGFRHSEETKKRMAEHIKTPEHCEKISEAKMGNKSRLGMKSSEETKKRISNAHKGVPWTVAQRRGRHNAVHVRRNVINPECDFCRKEPIDVAS